MFRGITILGAGELGATLARRLAERELARRIVLVDAEDAQARGKALDIAQSGPVEGFDVRVDAVARLDAAGPSEILVVADPPALEDASLSASRAAEMARELVPMVGMGTLVLAGTHAPALVEAVVRQGLARERALGSAPVAFAAALRRRLATDLQVEPRDVTALVLGLPPGLPVVPEGSVTVGGAPLARAEVLALRRALAVTRLPGPVALTAAAVRVIRALAGTGVSLVPAFALLAGEYGQREVALAVPARLAAGRLQSVVEVELQPVERVAFDNAAERRARQRM
jgi:malate dehydrogenase